jgi:nicotinate dehydrogenase subunit B
VPPTRLRFPFNLRAGMAAWNAAFHDPRPWQDDPARSAEWNRGAYLVEGAGHCGACHTPRNAVGAERGGTARYTGAEVDGWWAPPLAGSGGPVAWDEQAFFEYLRHGHAADHGVAGGPMAPVIESLQALPDSDLRAMAVYLTSLSDGASADRASQRAMAQARASATPPGLVGPWSVRARARSIAPAPPATRLRWSRLPACARTWRSTARSTRRSPTTSFAPSCTARAARHSPSAG